MTDASTATEQKEKLVTDQGVASEQNEIIANE